MSDKFEDEEQQAFPDGILNQDGMTLRDYFAAKAMAICPLRDFMEKAAWCYKLADAMMKAREA